MKLPEPAYLRLSGLQSGVDEYYTAAQMRQMRIDTLEEAAALAELRLECEDEVDRANENAILLERAADRILELESALRLCVAALDPQHAGRIARAALGETK